MTPSSGLTNMLQQFTEIWETFQSWDYQFIMKRCNSGTAKWKRYRGKKRKGVCSFLALWACHSPQHLCVFTTRKLSYPILRIFMKASLHSYDWLNHWSQQFNLQPLAPLQVREVGLKSSKPLIAGLVLPAISGHLYVLPKSHLINMTKDTFVALLGNSKGFKELCTKNREDQIDSFLL